MESLRHFRTRDGWMDLTGAALLLSISVVAAASIRASDDPAYGTVAEFGPVWLWLLVPGTASAFRRVWPVEALVAGTIGTAAIWGVGLPGFGVAASVLIYSAIVHGPEPAGLRWGGAAAIFLTGWTTIGVLVDGVPFFIIGVVAVTMALAVVVGANMKALNSRAEEAARRAREVEQRRVIEEDAAVQTERNRLARELHDVVAHGLSVIVVQTEAARRVMGSDMAAADDALNNVEQTAREALNEMRQVLGALRSDDDDPLRPTPDLSAITELVSDFEKSSGPVTLDLEVGTATGNNSLDNTAYRIVQESLTNVLKHAGPRAAADVRLRRGASHLEIVVSDDGRGAAADKTKPGFGLRGMRERVELLGGTFEAGARRGGGFEVRATLPVESNQ